MKRFLIVPSSLNREKSGFPTIKRNTWSFKRLFEHGGRGRDGRSLWKHESSGYDSIKAARLCTFPVILSKLAAKVIGKRQRGETEREGGRESAHPSHKEPSLRRKYSEFCISNPFARAKQPAETSFSKEAPLTFKWLLPAKQCRNFLSVFHISSAIPPSTPHLLLRQLFPRTTLSLFLLSSCSLSREIPFLFLCPAAPPRDIGIISEFINIGWVLLQPALAPAPLTNWKLVFSGRVQRLLAFNDCLRRDHSFSSVGNVYFSSRPRVKFTGFFWT